MIVVGQRQVRACLRVANTVSGVGNGSLDPPAGRLPTFFVIGAAKAGTSSVHHYLDAHPEIEMTKPKEPHLLCGPPDFRDRLWGYDVFLKGDAPLRGEVSPGYSTHPINPEIPDRIAAIAPRAPLVYLVRDPIDRAVAQYAEHVIQRVEQRPLADALDLDDPYCPYIAASRYATQVEAYLRRFDADRLLVVDSVDLRENRGETMATIFRHVGADPSFTDPSFQVEHYARDAENVLRPRAELAVARSNLYRKLVRPLVPDRARRAVRMTARRALGRSVSPVADRELRDRLSDALALEAQRLRELTGQRFASWSV